MTLTEQILAQSLLLAGDLTEQQTQILELLCTATASSLESRLRDGLTAEDCKADFIAAASLLALSSLNQVKEDGGLEQITAGDFTIKKTSSDAASNCLRAQAELLITPYLKDRFLFQGV